MRAVTPTLAQQFDPRMLSTLEGLDFKARYVMEGFLNGLHNSPFQGFSVEFSDYQKYQPGDDLRHLDWRLYARSDRLCIKRYMQETNARFYVVCDASASMEYRGHTAWGSKLECAKVLAAALTWFLLKQNDAAGMVTLSGRSEVPEFIRPSQRPTQLGLMLRQLELLRPSGGACLGRLLQHAARLIHRRSVVLFFSDLLEPSEEVALGFKQLRFQGHEVIVFQILDRDEITFPFNESKVFVDLESGIRRVISPKAVREKYRERFRAFMESHYALFRALEIPHCVVRTDENPCSALALFLTERKRRY
jgi:Uncharacterized conserved protein (some members contain a von Willebrand factor type A (vWA) domain)